ncbi:MAG: polyketide synthase [Enterococcus faecium]|mgnify:CR=1 FL=1|nr:polyketide synthase [Clostridioides difficile]MDU6869310.1 polyketide synthase [Enterococcus faecium]
MSGRFPAAENVCEYWSNLKNGQDCISRISEDDIFRKEYKNYLEQIDSDIMLGCLNNIADFDPLFFNISPREAEVMDPQQRIFLEEAWKAIEDAGYSNEEMSGKKCGVFVGNTMGDYSNILSKSVIENKMDIFSGISPSILPARISYFLNLKGPSIAIDTACSSSLVAVHLAYKSIISGECDMALAGGVRLMLTPELYKQSNNAGMLSSSNKCKPFDNSADGIVLGEAVGIVVLKDLEKAIEDGDHIFGVIRASGINQDGKTNGITAPSAASQTSLEYDVYNEYEINPEDITLVEAHGTGTKLGDPIEVKALKRAFSKYTSKTNYCALGSVKANIGHTTMAAGICSLIKVLMCFKNRQIPPQINYNNLNEHIQLNNSPFYITNKLIDWNVCEGKKRLAAISSFGFSGTNCHMVVEEP